MKTLASTLIALASVPNALGNGHQWNLEKLRAMPLVRGYEKRVSNEATITARLKTIFADIQNRASNEDGSRNRATHAEGSCYEGEFTPLTHEELFSLHPRQLVESLKQGVFASDTPLPAELRFANAKGERNSDKAPDVRGIGFSLRLPGGSRQDFSANSSPMFAVNNIHEFYELMKTVAALSGNFRYVPNPFYLGSTSRAARLLKEYERSDNLSFATESYWGNVPYTHGLEADGTPKQVVKFKLTPCDGQGIRREASQGKPDNFLRSDLARRALEGSVCLLYQVQFYNPQILATVYKEQRSHVDWVENAGELWPEDKMPFYTIGKLQIPAGSRAKSCEDWYVNPRLHSTPENRPIGNLSRVRAEVEEESRARRMAER